MEYDSADQARLDQVTAAVRDNVDTLISKTRTKLDTDDEAAVVADLATRLQDIPTPLLTGMLADAAVRLAKRT